MILEANFRPLESLVFNTSGEFRAGLPLSENLRRGLPVPGHQTLLGALGGALMRACGIRLSPGEFRGWKDAMDHIFSRCLGRDYSIRGALIRANGRLYAALGSGELIASLDALKSFFEQYTLEQLRKDLLGPKIDPEKGILSYFKGDLFRCLDHSIPATDKIRVRRRTRVGVKLAETGKTVERGYLYAVQETGYANHVGEPLSDLEFVLWLDAPEPVDSLLGLRSVVRLGGEGRLVELELSKPRDPEMVDRLRTLEPTDSLEARLGFGSYLEFAANDPQESVLLLVSPWILEFRDSGTLLVSNVLENLRTNLSRVLGLDDRVELQVFGRLQLLGGYDVLRNLRKPLEPALLQGSVLWISKTSRRSVRQARLA